MATLDNLLILGVRDAPDTESSDLAIGMTHYSLNIWSSTRLHDPTVVSVPYRGDYTGGFSHLTILHTYLFIADGEGIITYDLTDPSRGFVELRGVDEVSCLMAETPNYVVSCLSNLIQVRSLDHILQALHRSPFNSEQVDIPYRQFQHEGEGDTVLSMIPIVTDADEFVLLNDADDNTYLIEPELGQTERVDVRLDSEFPYAFQRQEQYHPIHQDKSKYLIFTESTSDGQEPNRVYSMDIRGPPIIEELEPLHFKGRQILSMLPAQKDRLTLLTNYDGKSHLEVLDPFQREIIKSRPLERAYDLGDRLQNVDDDLLIVRHLKNEIVDAESEQSITLTGAENDVAIPEISSTWKVPQYLYVARLT
ncbi:MAG: hypothetical protein IIA59_06750 [Candidatus Marinimicrobia bacterium]|nr:hypothetical protein [Candidatus Neomarinimicrobiota bacterium]